MSSRYGPSGRSLGPRRGIPSTRQALPSTAAPSPPPRPDRRITDGLKASPTQVIATPDEDSDVNIQITGLKYIGSYNWVEARTPTIIVPGSPPEWQNKPTPYSAPNDTGYHISDQNGHRCPKAILLPLIAAVELRTEHDLLPGFDWGSIDFVTDRNGLRKLMRWIDEPDTKEFRIDTQLAGKRTVLLNRWSSRTEELMSGYTYGFGFETASTKPAPGCEESTGHHRIVTYDFGGLKMVVRFEVDACLPTRANLSADDDLLAPFARLSVANSAPATILKPDSLPDLDTKTLTMRQGGSYNIRQASIVEIATLASHRRDTFHWTSAYPQLFLSQTPHHFLGYHIKGRFIEVKKRKLGSLELVDVEKKSKASFQKLRRALGLIQKVVVEGGQRGRLSLVHSEGELKVYERTSQESCLPDEVMALLER